MIEFIFYLSIFLILFPLVIYPMSLMLLSKLLRQDEVNYSEGYSPSITIIITAYNEEKVIQEKLNNLYELENPYSNVQVIVVSDGSSDNTDKIVADFSRKYSSDSMSFSLLPLNERLGKTHAQNMAVRDARGEILVFSDANSIWSAKALIKLVSFFNDGKVGYVSGKLVYRNLDNNTSQSESAYWNLDLYIRAMESKLGSTVGGNGAIYAIRKDCYFELPPILSHDGFMPTKVVLAGYKAKFSEDAIVYELPSDNPSDEFGRKVRMQRGQPWKKYYDIQKFNFFRCGIYTYFYLGHKYFKYILYITHPVALFSNIFLSFSSIFYTLILIPHVLFYILALLRLSFSLESKLFYFPYYYLMTICAQYVSIYNTISGKSSSIWEKAESTRK